MPQLQEIPIPGREALGADIESNDHLDAASDDSEEEYEDIEREDHQQIRDISSPPPKGATVLDAINDAPASLLKSLLEHIVQENAAADAIATKWLLASTSTGIKRKAHETCRNCGEEYSVGAENTLGACVYHEGEKELYEESGFWDDHNADVWGNPNDPDMQDDPTYDEGYRWTCCEQLSNADGCIISRHIPDVVDDEVAVGLKRRRIVSD